jgi:hypothetical protein
MADSGKRRHVEAGRVQSQNNGQDGQDLAGFTGLNPLMHFLLPAQD